MCDEMQKTLTMRDTPFLMLDVPRGCYKTSIVDGRGRLAVPPAGLLPRQPLPPLVYASNTLALGESFLTLIENILRSGGRERTDQQRTTARSGSRRTAATESPRRQNDGLFLKPRMDRGEIAVRQRAELLHRAPSGRSPSASTPTEPSSTTSTTRRTSRTAEQLKKTHEFYRQVYPIINTTDRIGEPAHIWMNCTPWHDNDVRGMIMREEEETKLEDPEYISPWRDRQGDGPHGGREPLLPDEALREGTGAAQGPT